MLSYCGRTCLVLGVSMIASSLWAGNWPQWRGPAGDGTAAEVNVPVAWSEKAGIVWKCKLPEWGNSTPAIWGNAVFLTSHVDNRRLLLVKIDKRTGKIAWTREVAQGSITPAAQGNLCKSSPQRGRQHFHESQNLASPSPVTDGEVVVVHFGNGELAAYDFDGRQLWRRNLQTDYGEYSIWWGHANSPVLYEDLVISACMQDSCSDLPDVTPRASYVVAHDKKTGHERWRTLRPTTATAESCDSYTTPVLRGTEKQTEVVLMGGQMLDAYDPASGRRLWYLPGLIGGRTISGPVVAQGMIFATLGTQHRAGGGQADWSRQAPQKRRGLEARSRDPRQLDAGRLGRLAVPGHQQRRRPLPGPRHRPAPLEGAAEGRIPGFAGRRRGPHLFPQHQGSLHDPLGGPAAGPPDRKPARRRDAGLARHFRRQALHPRPKMVILFG